MGLVLLVRHGQASFGREDYDVLSDTGLEQSRVLARSLAAADVVPSVVLTGAMRRQRDTAAAMVEEAGWRVRPEVDRGWDELDHLAVVARELAATGAGGAGGSGGSGGDLDPRGFQRLFESATARWAAGAHDEEYAESWPAFVARVRGALDRATRREGVTVVVTSGGPVAVACATLVDPERGGEALFGLWTAFNTVTVNASLTRVVSGPTGRRLVSFNEQSHLPRDLLTYR